MRFQMPTSTRLDFPGCWRDLAQSDRTAVCGPACTVVWQGRRGDSPPYADQAEELGGVGAGHGGDLGGGNALGFEAGEEDDEAVGMEWVGRLAPVGGEGIGRASGRGR